MNMKKEEKHNLFGSHLEQLMILAGVKNTLIAGELNYDTSYISKWITGKSIPSKKNIEKILSTISSVLVRNSTSSAKEELLARFNVNNDLELEEAICSFLRTSYYNHLGEMNEYNYINNASLNANSHGLFPLLSDYAKTLRDKNNLRIAVMADLFSLEPMTKLILAGIKNQRFTLQELRPDLKIDYIINTTKLTESSVYDILLLIHMTTCFSLTDFTLYHHSDAQGKLLISVDEEFAGVTLLGEYMQYLCTTSTRDAKNAQKLYQNLQSYTEPDKRIFVNTEMTSLLLSHQYIQSLLSQNARWLVGHMSEQFISPELFARLSSQFFTDELLEECKRAYFLSSNAIRTNQVQIMIYGLGLMHFALSGELDFFNHKVMLSPEEVRHELKHLQSLFKCIDENHIRLINEGFSDDFNYITNPYICLSSSIGYLRLENKQYTNNLLLVRDEFMQKTLDAFFNTIWNYDSNIVISNKEIMIQRLDTLLSASTLFSESSL